ncbi:MAG: hypothetical protein GTO53_12505 [Planctomycetales bacterium]|nr:hypothetical protein [Planctomycetales bacterium]NIM09924.1 hypothetical protein [Planctomycetales bacterium]NIN09363.1 hypothetical protein [Planctomycetales bacterium]NIN78472.1 hypothetical protein [Planctomycetales bacterium]NIO35663.1 hypothetical protein [Planctomycetales bacterium]
MWVMEGRCGSQSEEFKKWLVWFVVALLLVVWAFEAAGAADESPEETERVYIVSLWYGLFRAAEYPGGPPFVELGSHVDPDTIVGVIEPLMPSQVSKVVAVPAGYKGTITRVIIRDGEVVSIGQRLFEVLLDPPMPRHTPPHDSHSR